MIKKNSILATIISLSIVSCSKKILNEDYIDTVDSAIVITDNNSQSEKTNNYKIPYTIAHNYFVKNTFKADHFSEAKISTQAKFDEIFSAAAVMGAEGKPTTIDFAKQYVIAVTEKETNIETSIIPKSLTKVGKAVVFKYEIKKGNKTTFSMKPFLMLVIDSKYQGKVKVQSFEVK